jgi:hypothetical protein
MSLTDVYDDTGSAAPPAKVGYGCAPVHSRFKPGQSGNPSCRAKGSQNLKTIFNRVLDEEISLREGSEVRKVSKAEALVRGMIVGALCLPQIKSGHIDGAVHPEPGDRE